VRAQTKEKQHKDGGGGRAEDTCMPASVSSDVALMRLKGGGLMSMCDIKF
jgi:hypothetical protein